jgi:hypothetical protein
MSVGITVSKILPELVWMFMPAVVPVPAVSLLTLDGDHRTHINGDLGW